MTETKIRDKNYEDLQDEYPTRLMWEPEVVPGRYALVEEHVLSGGHWISTHEDEASAIEYWNSQTEPWLWFPLWLYDLDEGTKRACLTKMEVHPQAI